MTDSTEIAFILAAEGAMKQCFNEGKWQIIEPIMYVEGKLNLNLLCLVKNKIYKIKHPLQSRHQKNFKVL